MLRTLLCDEQNRFLIVEDAEAISDLVESRDRHLWLDVENPTVEELELIQEEFGLHPLAIEDAAKRHQRPKVDQYSNFYFVVFYSLSPQEQEQDAGEPVGGQAKGKRRAGLRGTIFHTRSGNGVHGEPIADRMRNTSPSEVPESMDVPGDLGAMTSERIILRELAMFLGENYLITVHEDPIPEFTEAARRWFRNIRALDDKKNFGTKAKDYPPGTRPLTPKESTALAPIPNDYPQPAGKERLHALGDTPIRKPSPAHESGEESKTQPSPGEAKNLSPKPDSKEIESLEDSSQRSSSIGILLYSLLDTVVDGYFPLVDTIVDRIEDLEEQIFERYDQRAIQQVFILKKDLLALRKVLAPERDVLNILARRDLPIFDENTTIYFRDVYDHVLRITDSIDTYRDLLSSALESFLSMQSNRLNITVQTLTSFSIILMSVAAVTGWYGMNFQQMPELASRFGYPGVMVVVAAIVALEVAYFKRKGWL